MHQHLTHSGSLCETHDRGSPIHLAQLSERSSLPKFSKVQIIINKGCFFLQEAIAGCRRSFSSYFEDSELTFTDGISVLLSPSDSDPSEDSHLPYCGNLYSRYLSLQGAESDKCYCWFLGM